MKAKREYLCELVDGKSRWSRRLTKEEEALGFLGWHQRGYLPHCDFPWLIQLVTFRLADSMPASSKGEWEHLLKIEDEQEKRVKLEEYLDRGVGECQLQDEGVASLTEAALLHFHKERYELLSWCVMPNHVHVLVHVWETPLGKIIKSWKQFVATNVDAAAERRPPARRVSRKKQSLKWQREYWDTYMRDVDQESKAVRYVVNNPVKAKFCRQASEWRFGSARFRSKETNELVQPFRKGGAA